jgi:putative transposase
VVRTWSPRGCTPLFYHSYRQDRISAISGLAVSPRRRHLALYLRLRKRNLKGPDVLLFLIHLLKHLRGHVFLLWDRGSIHRYSKVKAFIRAHPRLHVEFFPAYAPELNPAEFVWNQADRALANTSAEDLDELDGMLRCSTRRIRHSQRLLRSCIHASELPWPR